MEPLDRRLRGCLRQSPWSRAHDRVSGTHRLQRALGVRFKCWSTELSERSQDALACERTSVASPRINSPRALQSFACSARLPRRCGSPSPSSCTNPNDYRSAAETSAPQATPSPCTKATPHTADPKPRRHQQRTCT